MTEPARSRLVLARRINLDDCMPLANLADQLPEVERLQRLAVALWKPQLSAKDRQQIGFYLEQLASKPAALKALRGRRGRPKKWDRSLDIALDYLVCRPSRKQAKAAKADVADAWALSQAEIKEIIAEKGIFLVPAKHWYASLIKQHADWPRKELLQTISQELRKRNK